MKYDAVLSAVSVPTFQTNLLTRSTAVRLQALISPEILLDFYHFRGHHISEVFNIHSDGSDNLRCHT